jgi:hypothetical protein
MVELIENDTPKDIQTRIKTIYVPKTEMVDYLIRQAEKGNMIKDTNSDEFPIVPVNYLQSVKSCEVFLSKGIGIDRESWKLEDNTLLCGFSDKKHYKDYYLLIRCEIQNQEEVELKQKQQLFDLLNDDQKQQLVDLLDNEQKQQLVILLNDKQKQLVLLTDEQKRQGILLGDNDGKLFVKKIVRRRRY